MDRAPGSRLRLALGAIGVLVIVLTGLLMPFPFKGPVGKASADLFHSPLFAALTLGLFWSLDQVRPLSDSPMGWASRTALTVVVVVVFATATEAMQGWVGRNASWSDAVANAIGATMGALCYWSWRFKRNGHVSRGPRYLLLAAAAVLLAIAWWNPLRNLHHALAADEIPPSPSSVPSPEVTAGRLAGNRQADVQAIAAADIDDIDGLPQPATI